MSQKRTFSCPECGEPYVAYPPSDDYNRVSLKHPNAGSYDEKIGVRKVVHDCRKCKQPIELFWYRSQPAIFVG